MRNSGVMQMVVRELRRLLKVGRGKRKSSIELKRMDERIRERLSFDATLALTPGKPVVLALFGAMGSGKTSTVSKLAVWLRRAFELQVAIGEVRQDMSRGCLSRLRGVDVMLLDTPRCDPDNPVEIECLSKMIASMPECEPILILSAKFSMADIRRMLSAYEVLGYRRVVVTGLDECSDPEGLVSVLEGAGKALAYFATGPKFPNDLEPATAKRLASLYYRKMSQEVVWNNQKRVAPAYVM